MQDTKTTMVPPPSIFHELESGAAGKYLPNRAFIKLHKKCAFWRPEISASHEDYAVFLHEYAHYLHNFSTVAGISDFMYELRTVQFFARTVGVDGTSIGLEGLDPTAQHGYSGTQKLRQALRGDFGLPDAASIHQRGVDVEYVGHTTKESTFRFPDQVVAVDVVALDLLVTSASAEATSICVNFGTMLLTEGVAFELECYYLSRRGLDMRKLQERARPMPYKVARRVLEGITQKNVSHELCIKASLVALQSTDAGATFVGIAAKLRDAPDDMESAMTRLAEKAKEALRDGSLPRLVAAIADSIRPLASRRPLGRAMRHFEANVIAYVSARIDDPFFELGLANCDPASIEFSEFLARFPPCVIQVCDPDSDDPDPLEYLWGSAVNQELVESLAAYHTMMDFSLAHCAQNLERTDALKPRPCPFTSSCSLPLKKSNSDVCERRPWKAFDPSSRELCWYAVGVGAVRGRVEA